MVKCVFCDYQSLKKLPGTEVRRDVHEDENCLCVLDMEPWSPGHTLVILKEHRKDITAASQEEMCSIVPALMRCCNQMKKQLDDVEKVYVASICEDGKSPTEHLHFHLIPRYKRDKRRGAEFMFEGSRNRRVWQPDKEKKSENKETIEETRKLRRKLLLK